MKDSELYERLLGSTAPWEVKRVSLVIEKCEVEVHLGFSGSKYAARVRGRSIWGSAKT